MVHKPVLNVLSNVKCLQFLPLMLQSVQESAGPWFRVVWRPYLVPRSDPLSMGAGLMWGVRQCVPTDWCIILDDDNRMHPSFGAVFSRWIQDMGRTRGLVLFNQVDAQGQPRRLVCPPRLKGGGVDAAQFGFRAQVAFDYPIPDISAHYDGAWAEVLAKAPFDPPFLPAVLTYCNYYRALEKAPAKV